MNKVLTLLVGFSLAACAAGLAQASPYSDTSSNSDVDPQIGASATDTGTTSSNAVLDSSDFAKSFITLGTSTMGAEVSGTGTNAGRLYTETSHNDSWWLNCDAQHICESTTPVSSIPVSLTFGIKVAETQVTGDAFLEFKASYSLPDSGGFYFNFTQDGPGDFELSSYYSPVSGNQVDVPVTWSLNNGVYTLTANMTVNDQVCDIYSPCIPSAMSCESGTCSGTPAFTDSQDIIAWAEGMDVGEQDTIDGYDPFSVNILSLDPNYQFISADGRTIPTSDAPASVPEPSTLALFGLGVVAAGLSRRRGGIKRNEYKS